MDTNFKKREEATSALTGYRTVPLPRSNWNLKSFCGGRKTGESREKPSNKATTSKPHMTPRRNRTQATLVGGEHSQQFSVGWQVPLI